jgi:hypothetical protein
MITEPNNNQIITMDQENGSHWHSMDIIRFFHHKCFWTPGDIPLNVERIDFHPLILINSQNKLIIYPIDSLISIDFKYENRDIKYWLIIHNNSIQESSPGLIYRLLNNTLEINLDYILNTVKDCSLQLVFKDLESSSIDNLLHNIQINSQENGLIYSQEFGTGQLLKNNQYANSSSCKLMFFDSLHGHIKKLFFFYDIYLKGILAIYNDNHEINLGSRTSNYIVLENFNLFIITQIDFRCGWWIDGLQIFTSPQLQNSQWIGGTGGKILRVKIPQDHQVQGFLINSDNQMIHQMKLVII